MNAAIGTSPNIQGVLSALYQNENGYYGLPYQVWKPEYDENTDLLIEEIIKPLINHLSNSTFYGGLYSNSYNPLRNYDKYNGIFSTQKEAYSMLYLYGDFENESEEKMRDFNFYWYAVSRIEAELSRHDLRYSVDIVNREAGEKKKEKVAKVAAEAQIRNVLKNIQQQTQSAPDQQDGEDLSFAKDKDVYVPTDIEELYNLLNEKEISSAQTYDLINHCKEKYNIKRKLYSENLKDKCIINACFGKIEINNEDDPEYEVVQPHNIGWIGPDKLGYNGFDDCDAVQVTEYIPVTKAFLKDRGLHDTNLNTAQKIIDKIKQFTEQKQDGKSANETRPFLQEQQFGQYWFYRPGTGMFVCRQHLFFKMLHPKRVKLTINGKNLTDEQFKDFKNYGKNKEDIDFKVVEDDHKEKEEEKVISIPIVKLHECIRYGEDNYLLVREYPNQLRRSNNWINCGFPLTACVWKEKSIVTLGTDFAYLHHAAMKKFMEEIKHLSVSDMLNYDVDNLPDGYGPEMIPLMIRDKLNLYSGSKLTNQANSKESYRHLQSTKVSVSPNELIALLNLAMITANTYYKLLGLPIETNFINKTEAVGEQEAPVQGSLALISFYDEFIEDYINQVFQKMADIGRYAWSRTDSKTVIIGKGKTKTMKIDTSTLLDEQGIFVVNDYKSRKDKEFLMNAGMKALSAGGVTFAEIVKMYHSDNPERIQAMFEEGMSVLDKLREQDNQIKQQGLQQQAELGQMKLQVPILVQQEITKRELQKQEMIEKGKDEREAAKMDFKGETQDIKHEQDKDMEEFKKNIGK